MRAKRTKRDGDSRGGTVERRTIAGGAKAQRERAARAADAGRPGRGRAVRRALARTAKVFLVAELSTGQLVDDVRLALAGRAPVEFFSRVGGNVPGAEDVLESLERTFTPSLHHEEALAHV